MLRVMGSRGGGEAGRAKINILKSHSSPAWGIDRCGRAVPQGKHKKMVLEAPPGVLVKCEGSLDEACAVSLPLCLWLTSLPPCPAPHLHTSPLLSISLGCPVSILVPRAGRGVSP